MINILITTNVPSPYFVDYANELSKYANLTVLFELNNAKDRDKNWQQSVNLFCFNYVFLNAKKITADSGLSFKVKKYLKDRKFNKIIIANPTTPTGILSLLYLRKHKIPFIIQSEGGFSGSGKGIKEKFKKYLMEKAEFYLTGMGDENDYFLTYGATKERLKKYYFTSLRENDIDENILIHSEKLKLRKQLGLDFKHMILYVGQFIDRKNLPSLLRAYAKIQRDDICLVLIGGQSTDKYKKIEQTLHLKNVFYKSFMSKNNLKKYYRCADLFVLPTKEDTWGLVINEAMSHGLPVISSDKCIAARYLVKNNVNGYIYNVNDEDMLSRYIQLILQDNKLSSEMGKKSINYIKEYTIENMARTIIKYLE